MITFRLSEDDVVALHRAIWRRLQRIAKANSKKLLFDFVAWFPIGIFVMGFVELYRRNPQLAFDLYLIGGSLVLGVAAMIVGHVYLQRRYVRALRAPDSWFFENQMLEVQPDGIRTSGAYGESLFRWSAFRGLEEDEHRLLLFVDNAQALVLPKMALGSHEEEVIRSRVSSAR